MIKKISKWQLVFLLLLCRIFTLMTYVPAFTPNGGISLRLKAAVISISIQALLIIPLIILELKHPDRTITAVIFEKNSVIGFIAAVLYLLYFISLCSGQVLHFVGFLSDSFLGGEKLFPLAAILIVCAYCAYCGTEGLARSSVLLMIPFVLMLAVMIYSTHDSFNINNFYSENGENGLIGAVLDDLERNGEIIAAAFLMKNVKEHFKCAVYWLLAAKLIVTAAVFALITGVLGDYSTETDYPFLAVGSFTESGLFRQNGALYLIIWTISAVISIALYLSIVSGIIGEILPDVYTKNTISALAVFIIAAVFLYYNADFSSVRTIVCGGLSQAVLIAVIPIIVLLSEKCMNRKRRRLNE